MSDLITKNINKMKISEIDNDKITNAAKKVAKTTEECWYMYEQYLKPHVFRTGIMYGLVAGTFIGIIMVMVIKIFWLMILGYI